MTKILPVKLLQKLHCQTSYIRAGTVIEKENTASHQARAFLPDGFLQELQGCTIAICIHYCHMVQEIENALGIQNFAKSKILLCKAFSLLSRIFKLCIDITVQPQYNKNCIFIK
jgi:hypothetical protein